MRLTQHALSSSAPLRYVSFAALYLAQGIPQGFLLLTIPGWMAANGVDAGTVGGMVGLMVVPWTFKVLAGPLMDRYSYLPMGRRRPWLMGAQALLLLSTLGLALVPDPLHHLPLLGAMGFVVSCCGAVQDVATDGLAVDIIPEAEQARANGLMWGAKTAGMSGTLATGTWAIQHFGFATAVLGLSAALLLVMAVPSLLRERPGEKRFPWSSGTAASETLALKAGTWGEILFTLRKGFLLRTSLLGASCLVLYGFLTGLKDTQLPLFTIGQLGWANEAYANTVAAANLGSALVAMVVAGWLADRVGKVRIISFYLLLMAALWATLAFAPGRWGDTGFITAMVYAQQAVETFCTVALFATAMHLCWQRVAATQFTLYMVCNNVGYAAAGAALGGLRGALDWTGMFMLCGSLPLTAGILVLYLRLHRHTDALAELEQAHLQRLAELNIQPELGVPGSLVE